MTSLKFHLGNILNLPGCDTSLTIDEIKHTTHKIKVNPKSDDKYECDGVILKLI